MKMKTLLTLSTIGAVALTCAAMPPRFVPSDDAPANPEDAPGKTVVNSFSDPFGQILNQSKAQVGEQLAFAEVQAQGAENPFTESSATGTASTLDNQEQGMSGLTPFPSFAHAGHSAPSPLMIRSCAADPKEQGGLEEDLAVMSHILDKALDEKVGNQPRGRKAMGIDV